MSLAASKCSLIRNPCRSYFDPDLTRQNHRAAVLVQSGAGKVIGELVNAFDKVEARRLDDNGRMVAKPFRDRLIGEPIGELLHLCNWKLDCETPRRQRHTGNV